MFDKYGVDRDALTSIYSNSYKGTISMLLYYVYAYLRKSDLTPYYIGKGKDKRYKGRHTVNIPPDDSRIVFLETHLTNVGACALERRYIEWYGRKDLGTGILRNLTNGGEGPSGYVHTAETKAILSALAKGKSKPPRTKEHMDRILEARKDCVVSDETRAKMSATRRGKPSGRKGMPMTNETCEKISLALKGKAKSLDHIAKAAAARWPAPDA